MVLMPDITFFYTPQPYHTNPTAQVGLGMLLIATYCRDLGAKVEMVFAQGSSMHAAKLMLKKTDMLCLSGCMVDAPYLNGIAEHAKEHGLANYIIAGGPIGKSPEMLDDAVDCVVDGYGEDVVADAFLRPAKRPQWFVKADRLLRDMNDYPYPDRRLLPYQGGRIFRHAIEPTESTTLLTSRGCRYRCAFCTSGNESFVQDYSIERIERELDDIALLGIRQVRISDDNLIHNAARLGWLSGALRRREMRWRASIRTKPNDIDTYKLIHDCGCEEVSFGVESGDQGVLNLLHKGVRVEENTRAVRNAIAAGIPTVRPLMMMGTPGETPDTLERNKTWVEDAGRECVISLKMFIPYPGTAIYAMPEAFGCRIEDMGDPNNNTFRGDGSRARAHISIIGGMSRDELTAQLYEMLHWLEERGQVNRG